MAELDDKVIVTKDKITTIADTIRETGGTSARMTLDEMPDNIRAIGEGGGNVVVPLFIKNGNNYTCNLTFAKIEEIYAGTGDTKASMPQLIYSGNDTRSIYCNVAQENEDAFSFDFNIGAIGITNTGYKEKHIVLIMESDNSIYFNREYTLEYQKPVVAGDGIELENVGTGTNRKTQISVADTLMIRGESSGSVASFDDGADDIPLKSCMVAIEPVQSGSGDPSPSNVRPITGWTECNITVADDETTPTISNVYNIEFPSQAGIVYGGTLDVTNGVLIVDRVMVDMGTLDWGYSTTQSLFGVDLVDGIHSDNTNLNGICEIYKCVQGYNPSGGINDPTQDNAFAVGSTFVSTNWNLLVRDSRYTDATAFKTAMNGVKCVYRLTTPTTYNVTPTEIKTLLGINNIFADCGDVDVEYVRDATLIINKLLELVSGNNNRTMMKSAVVEKTDEVQEQKKDNVEENLDA